MAMKITLVLTLVALVCLAMVEAKGDCPSASKNLNCTPRCLNDSECTSNGGKCCPNLCNAKSCAAPHLLTSSGAENSSPFSKSSSTSGASGSYCGNTKCSTFEKCQMDRSTARPKCVRA